MLAGQPDVKSCMADHILFKKESDFCMTFGLAIGWPTLRWLANFLKIQAFCITISPQYYDIIIITHLS